MKFVMDNIWLFLVALLSGVMFLMPNITRRMSGVQHVSTLEAVQMMNRRDAVVVDVREAGEFKAGHVTGARNLPLKELQNRLGELEKFKNKPILLLCQTGNRSSQAGGILKKAGFSEIANLTGGLHAWQQAGMPLEKAT